MIHAKNHPASPHVQRHWLFWDGECGFCRHTVHWLKKRDRARIFLTVPYQDAPSPPMTAQLREQCRKAVVILTSHGETLTAGRACTFALEQVGYYTLGRILRWPVFRTFVEWGYRWVSRNRGWLGRILFRESDPG